MERFPPDKHKIRFKNFWQPSTGYWRLTHAHVERMTWSFALQPTSSVCTWVKRLACRGQGSKYRNHVPCHWLQWWTAQLCSAMPGYVQPIASRLRHICGSLFNAMQISGRLCRFHFITMKFFTLFQSCCHQRYTNAVELLPPGHWFRGWRVSNQHGPATDTNRFEAHKPILYNWVIELVQNNEIRVFDRSS